MSVRVMADGRRYSRTDCREVRERHQPSVVERWGSIARCMECGRPCHRVTTPKGNVWRHDPGTFWSAQA